MCSVNSMIRPGIGIPNYGFCTLNPIFIIILRHAHAHSMIDDRMVSPQHALTWHLHIAACSWHPHSHAGHCIQRVRLNVQPQVSTTLHTIRTATIMRATPKVHARSKRGSRLRSYALSGRRVGNALRLRTRSEIRIQRSQSIARHRPPH